MADVGDAVHDGRQQADDAARPVGADREDGRGAAEDQHDHLGGLVVVVEHERCRDQRDGEEVIEGSVYRRRDGPRRRKPSDTDMRILSFG